MDQAYNHMHGLSQLATPEQVLPLRLGVEGHQKKHEVYLDFLTCVAAVLTFKPEGKVATTALLVGRIEILWAKDAAVDSSDIHYHDAVFNCQLSSSIELLRQLIVPRCRTSILCDADELYQAFQPSNGSTNLFNWTADNPGHLKLRDH
jgi:hypothetical protein